QGPCLGFREADELLRQIDECLAFGHESPKGVDGKAVRDRLTNLVFYDVGTELFLPINDELVADVSRRTLQLRIEERDCDRSKRRPFEQVARRKRQLIAHSERLNDVGAHAVAVIEENVGVGRFCGTDRTSPEFRARVFELLKQNPAPAKALLKQRSHSIDD